MFKYSLLALVLIGLTGGNEKPDPLRLNHSVVPRAQRIALSLDPDSDRYHGVTEIQVELTEKVDSFRFHAKALEIHSIELKSGSSSHPLDFTVGEKGTITASYPSKLKPGDYTLQISFENDFSRQGTGIYKVEYEGKNYLFTQMEPEYARESFPCWDAPEFKIPWELQLTIPEKFTAYANTPVNKTLEAQVGKSIAYEESKPMPSYLVAFAVGDFEEVAVPGLPVPGRILVPNGKSELASEAARISPPLLKALEDYFEIPCPYRKLDQVAVPEFNFGAMENAGLITYRDTTFLRDVNAMNLGQKQWHASIVAHEMSHMWFGNLVTPKWWDDLWLNESFASWIALKMVNQTFPEYEMQNYDIKSRQKAFRDDALSTSRPIRRPIAASDAMSHLFDRLAYNKGMAVLDMVEDWMGEELFRQGMIQYMNDRAWGNADAFDLAESLGGEAVGEILEIMTSFVTQAGIPLLTFELVGDSKIRIHQIRYSHYGVEYDDDPAWNVPITLKYGSKGKSSTRKLLLTKKTQTFKIEHAADWFYPNANEKGYYRWHIPEMSLTQLSGNIHQLDVRNRMGFISNTEALFTAGLLNGGDFIKTMAAFSGDSSPEVRQAVVDNLSGLADSMVPPDLEASYGQYLHTVFRPMLDAIGIKKKPQEDALIEQLRTVLIGALGWRCRDEEILKIASANAQAYMADPYSVDPSLATPFLRLAASHGDASLFDAYVAKFESVTVPIEKESYLNGLSGFRDRELMVRALDYALSEKVPPHQFGTIPYNLADKDVNRTLVMDWLRHNFPAIQEKVPEQSISYFPWLACGQSIELMNEAKTFLLTEERKTQGLEIEFGKIQAIVELNARLREKELINIQRFLGQ